MDRTEHIKDCGGANMSKKQMPTAEVRLLEMLETSRKNAKRAKADVPQRLAMVLARARARVEEEMSEIIEITRKRNAEQTKKSRPQKLARMVGRPSKKVLEKKR
jgi:hypothetical protein